MFTNDELYSCIKECNLNTGMIIPFGFLVRAVDSKHTRNSETLFAGEFAGCIYALPRENFIPYYMKGSKMDESRTTAYTYSQPIPSHHQNIEDDIEKGADYLFRQTTDLTHKRCRELVAGIFYAIHNAA